MNRKIDKMNTVPTKPSSSPIIAKINGAAAGLGATLALYCDITMAADTARIGDPHVKVGLTAGDGGSGIWPYLIGFARAREFLYTGEMLTADRATDMGLINRCIPADDLDRVVDEFALIPLQERGGGDLRAEAVAVASSICTATSSESEGGWES